ncbi:Hypp2008 [Branchiostoma lanceolatum]|uniref:Hypp2008 protein n=1 Tax=Branchiostoma lanceolatum TaxID=7740 RepID=A0A8K0ELB8_BRALA|nr:Hypp2008 [Branchiostoma lanceolatum]
MCSTPIHRWEVPGLPDDVELFIKREDMTGCALSGNKVCKLEFQLAEAIRTGCSVIIGCGSRDSNQCRTTAVAARRLGLESHFLIKSGDMGPESLGWQSNILLQRLVGAHLYIVHISDWTEKAVIARMDRLADDIRKRTGKKSYIIPPSGYDLPGLYGYFSVFQDLISQGLFDKYDDLVGPSAAGAMFAGLAIANYLTGAKIKCHGIQVTYPAEIEHHRLQHVLTDIGLSEIRSHDIIDVISGYQHVDVDADDVERDYDVVVDVAMATGVILDPHYGARAVRGLLHQLNTNRHRFKGNRLLYIHTGGIFSVYEKRMQDYLQKKLGTARVVAWEDGTSVPFVTDAY